MFIENNLDYFKRPRRGRMTIRNCVTFIPSIIASGIPAPNPKDSHVCRNNKRGVFATPKGSNDLSGICITFNPITKNTISSRLSAEHLILINEISLTSTPNPEDSHVYRNNKKSVFATLEGSNDPSGICITFKSDRKKFDRLRGRTLIGVMFYKHAIPSGSSVEH